MGNSSNILKIFFIIYFKKLFTLAMSRHRLIFRIYRVACLPETDMLDVVSHKVLRIKPVVTLRDFKPDILLGRKTRELFLR